MLKLKTLDAFYKIQEEKQSSSLLHLMLKLKTLDAFYKIQEENKGVNTYLGSLIVEQVASQQQGK